MRALPLILVLVACGAESSHDAAPVPAATPATTPTSGAPYSLVADSAAGLPTCDATRDHALAYTTTDTQFWVCNPAVGWAAIATDVLRGPQGQPGATGTPGAAGVAGAAGADATPSIANQWTDAQTGKLWLLGGVDTLAGTCVDPYHIPTSLEVRYAYAHGLAVAFDAIISAHTTYRCLWDNTLTAHPLVAGEACSSATTGGVWATACVK